MSYSPVYYGSFPGAFQPVTYQTATQTNPSTAQTQKVVDEKNPEGNGTQVVELETTSSPSNSPTPTKDVAV
jgi:hypothetical protein